MTSRYPASSAYTTPPNSQGDQPFPTLNHISNGTPSNFSPSSPPPSMFPNFPLSTHQLRPPKSPLYIPAVLRPTERPRRPSPFTPPRSVNNSTDSLTRNEGGRPPTQRASVSDDELQRVASVGDTCLNPVEGPPQRSHWKPDYNALMCDAPTCQKSFSLFERRHHCRHCGFVFCGAHSPYTVPLDHRAEFHPDGMASRACKICWNQYEEWIADRLITMKDNESVVESVGSGKDIQGRRKEGEGRGGGLAASVPKDWNWSTF
ncbi:hypothetical protein MMC31_006493 [Peltigera leucophlebia]|nr:hypothetical protein [Peltigera leucophlebia]